MARAGDTLSERWFFYQDTANLWKWARLDLIGTVLAQAHQAFGTRDACVADARRSGYDPAPQVPHSVRFRRAPRRASGRQSRRI